jgi:catechol-2,3-dioxygenase
MSISPVRLNHAVLFVSDVDRAVAFYRDVLGMELVVAEPRARAAFLRLPRSSNHHDLGLFGIGAAPRPGRGAALGLYHLAWQLDTIDELAEARGILLEHGAYVGESSHGATKSLYAQDPDGNELELMWMLPREAWGDFATSATVEHLDLAGEVRRWSGRQTSTELVPRLEGAPS